MEVLVMDDGSTDGTADMIRAEFPSVHYHRFAGGMGPCYLRNRGAELATTNYLFPIDDDAVFKSSRTVEQTLRDFAHPRVAAVGIPFVNVHRGPDIFQRAPDPARIHCIEAFVGASHAVRRDLFLQHGGYREHLFYMGEEGDLCARMLDRGYVTRVGTADEPVQHYESPSRVMARAAYYGRRNDVLYSWHNVPWPAVLARLPGTTLNGVRFAFTKGFPQTTFHHLRGLTAGYLQIPLRRRQPLKRSTYRLLRQLRRRGMIALEEIEELLPPLSSV
jgi:glycosyltransferase involved in cell wall biosynthesis